MQACSVGRNIGDGFFMENQAVSQDVLRRCARRLKQKTSKTITFSRFSQKMVGAEGVEPSTFWSRTKRATRLRYAPNGVEMGVRIAK